MKDLRIPGGIWVILLLLGGVFLQAYSEPLSIYLHLSPLVIGGIVSAIFIAAKWINPGTKELNQAIDVIQTLLGKTKEEASIAAPTGGMRSSMMGVESKIATIRPEDIPERPNKVARILIG